METRHLTFPISPDAMMQPEYISAPDYQMCAEDIALIRRRFGMPPTLFRQRNKERIG